MTELSYFVVIFVHDQKVFLQVLMVLKCHCDENKKNEIFGLQSNI